MLGTVVDSQTTPDLAPVLEVRGMRKEFPGTLALDDVSLSVRRGEIHALLGENGAGKSTLIKCICGAYAPTAGEVLVEGHPASFSTPREAVDAGIAVVHQHLNLVPNLTVAENLWLGEAMPRRLGLVDWPRVHARASQVLADMGLEIATNADIGSLRPDQLAMISIAKAVSGNARIIILDEPTNALLPHEVDRLFDQMRALAAKGHSFLYVSHRLSEVFEIADRATVLRDGRNAGVFERDEMDRRSVVEAIVGKKGALAERRTHSNIRPEIVMEVCDLEGGRAKGVSFGLHAGEIIGVAGLPGSGAEDVLNLLFGRSHRVAGEVRVQGLNQPLRTPGQAIAAGIALVPADRLAEAVFHAESIRANISMPSLSRYLREPLLRLINRGAESAATTEVATRMRVRMPGIETKIDDLSGGNQQKVVLGRWLSTGARIFLLNSPTAAVDVGAKAEIYDLIHELAADGVGVVFASTELEEYALVCDRVLVFSGGQVVSELSGDALTEGNIMTLAAGGELHDVN
ncbi:sugar ABC transporter ATP-binding protein [Pararhodobacter sp.]|uniref:sugar ABC transporter ATP-binding protein n=1 Tax=Pararhodobacter sp. TaxID=2127056 RepID=UPI002AFE5DE5|nr:sugar ABC transporter ATP-binding protein [Pararhodobacter sp.]